MVLRNYDQDYTQNDQNGSLPTEKIDKMPLNYYFCSSEGTTLDIERNAIAISAFLQKRCFWVCKYIKNNSIPGRPSKPGL